MQSITRRSFLSTATIGAIGATVGCASECASERVLKTYAIIAISIGPRLVRLPHPALRILGATLIVTGNVTELALIWINAEDCSEEKLTTRITVEEWKEIESKGYLQVTRADGQIEEVILSNIVVPGAPNLSATPNGR